MASKKKLKKRIKSLEVERERLLKLGRKFDPRFGQLFLRDLIPIMRIDRMKPLIYDGYEGQLSPEEPNTASAAWPGEEPFSYEEPIGNAESRVEWAGPYGESSWGVPMAGGEAETLASSSGSYQLVREIHDADFQSFGPVNDGPFPIREVEQPIEPPVMSCDCWNPFHNHHTGNSRTLNERIDRMLAEHDEMKWNLLERAWRQR